MRLLRSVYFEATWIHAFDSLPLRVHFGVHEASALEGKATIIKDAAIREL